MRRILHIIDSLGYNGAATQLLVLAKALASQKYDVHVCSLARHAPRTNDLAALGIPTTIIPRRWTFDPFADWQLVRYVRRLQPDVVHTWNTVPGMLGPITARRPFVAGHYHIERCKLPAEWAIERRFAGRASRYISNSDAVRRWLLQHEIAVDKSVVIPTGIEPTRPSDLSRDELLRQLNLPPDALLIGVIGQLIPENRVKDLIWAADLLRVLHNNLRLLVIGDGPLRAQLEEYARLASDLEHIHFLGAGNDVWRITPHLSALWNASENTGQSASILEAMAAGVPVVASDTQSNRELIVDNECGFLIPLGTRAGRAARARQTHRIFTEPALAARLAKNAQARVASTFSATRSLTEHLELYDLA